MRTAWVLTAFVAFVLTGCGDVRTEPATLAPSALASASELKVENLGPVQRVARYRGHAISRGTDSYPPRLLLGLADGDGNWVVNLADGSSHRAAGGDSGRQHMSWPSATRADGKLFAACYGRGGLMVYDPVADSSKIVYPIPRAHWLRGVAVGADGGVYVADYPHGAAARYDPDSGKIDYYGPQGGPFRIKKIYGHDIASDGRWVYTLAGQIPWYVVAYDRQTGTQTNLFRFGQGKYPMVRQRGDEVYLQVKFAATRDADREYYRLSDGRAERVDAMPDEDDSRLPGFGRPQPEVQAFGRNLPLIDGGALLRYRPAGAAEWTHAVIPVKGVPLRVAVLAPTGDGRVLLYAGPYGDVYIYDPASATYKHVGSPAGRSVYGILPMGETIYFCGYVNAVLGRFEGEDTGDGKIIGLWHYVVGSMHSWYMVAGADGRIYTGNHAERDYVGGSLGWYDPATGKMDGIRLPNDDCSWLTTAMGGRLIVYSSAVLADPAHPEIEVGDGRLIVYDTQTGTMAPQSQWLSPLRDNSAGKIVEIAPGVVLGLGLHDGAPAMYTADVVAGKLLRRVALPAKGTDGGVVRGPDGKVYAFLGNTLVRIDPATLAIEPIGKARPGRMLFIGPDLYLTGSTHLRRISNVAG